MIYIHLMNLAALDLNLLVALHALLAEASVGRAAQRIGLSQPATSHALRRLRDLFDDALLVRTGRGMELTPRGEALREPVAAALDRVARLFDPPAFDPATSRRRFRIMIPDLAASILMPPLVERVGVEAPNVVIEVVGWRGPDVMTPEFVRSIDIIVNWDGESFPGFHRQTLYRDRDALAVRRDRPARDRLRQLDGFVDARHVAVVGRGEAGDPIDVWLAGQGLERRVVLVVPTYLQALQVAAASDLVAFVPGRLIAALAGGLRLAAVPPPIDPGEDEQFMFYPTRHQAEPGSIWLRRLVGSVAARL